MAVRRFGYMAFLLLAVAALTATGVGAAPTTFTDPQGRFSFTVPDGYQRSSDSSLYLAAFTSPTYAGANVNTGAQAISTSNLSLDAIADQVLTGVAGTLKDFQRGPKGIETTTLGGQPARRYEYSVTVSNTRAHGLQYVTLYRGTAYFLTFTASEADFAAFMKESMIVVDSFAFLGGAGTTPTTAPATVAPTAPTAPAATAPTASASSGPRPFFIRRLGDG